MSRPLTFLLFSPLALAPCFKNEISAWCWLVPNLGRCLPERETELKEPLPVVAMRELTDRCYPFPPADSAPSV